MQGGVLRQRPAHRLAGVPGFARVAIDLDRHAAQADIDHSAAAHAPRKVVARMKAGACVALVIGASSTSSGRQKCTADCHALIDPDAVNRADKIGDKLSTPGCW